jgi:hypothetical protein
MTLRFATKILLTSALTAVVGLAIVSGASAMRNDSDPFNLGYRGEVSPAVSHSERLRILVAIAAKNNKAAKKTVKAAAWSFPHCTGATEYDYIYSGDPCTSTPAARTVGTIDPGLVVIGAKSTKAAKKTAKATKKPAKAAAWRFPRCTGATEYDYIYSGDPCSSTPAGSTVGTIGPAPLSESGVSSQAPVSWQNGAFCNGNDEYDYVYSGCHS